MKKTINLLFIFITVFLVVVAMLDLLTQSSYTTVGGNKGKKIKKASGAMESMQFFSQIRAFPDIDIPADKFFKGFEQSKNIHEIDLGDSPTQWSSIGPNNIGGRSISFAIHPIDTSILFMGSASGGLWKSTTGGLGANAWTLINTGFPSNAVSSIVIDSANTNIMYIGTGENYGYQYSSNGLNIRITRGMYGIGILKTTNGGSSWTKSLDWSYQNQRGVWAVVMNPKNHNTLYAATTEGVWKTINAGGSWTQVNNFQMVMDLKLNPVDTSMLFISVGNLSNNIPNANVGIYKSTNAGGAWVKLSDGTHGLPTFWSGKTTLAMYQGNPNYIYASVANDPSNSSNSYVGLFYTSDAGNTWVQRYNNPSFMTNQGWYNNAILIKSNDVNTVLVGNLDVYRTTNGGSSFSLMSNWSAWNTGATPPGQPESGATNYSHADQHYFASNPKDPNKFYSITDGGLYRSNDFGTVYYSCNGGYVTTQFYGGFANSFQDSIYCIGGLQDNRSTFYQGSVAWYKTFQGDGMWCGVNSQNSQICYTEYTYGSIYRSYNGGLSWSSIPPPGSGNENNYCFAAPYIVCRSNPSIMYVGGTSIYKSTVGGGSWQGPFGSFGGTKVLSMDCSATSTDTLYCGTVPTSSVNAAVYKTVNGGTTFTNISGPIPNRYPIDMHVNPNNSKELYVVFGGFGTGHVYRTSDGGTTWVNISGSLPDVPHQSVVIDPQYPQNVYVGNDLGVYVTTNNGTSWNAYMTGMPYALVLDLVIVYPNRHIRAVTHGNGVYERSLVPNPLVGVVHNTELPKDYKIHQNYPNPFNPTSKIKYEIPKNSYVVMSVFDISGKLVKTLVNEKQNAGSYEVRFDGSNLSSGTYFYRINADGFVDVKKMILIK
ncbi:MAG: T9SS C-terminal target domain-containing protein [Ignavibacteriae bacterium]|nr:MAG: T9SS C-terminal target domain-containing protein [Ignavibacteriota bacterium]